MNAVDISPARAMAYVARYAPRTRSIIYQGGDLTAADVDARSARLAAILRDGGVGEGTRVTYHGLNSPSLLLTYLACARLKAVFLPMNFRLMAPEVEHILNDSGTHTVIAEPGFTHLVDRVAGAAGRHRCLVIDDDPAAPPDSLLHEHWQRLSELMATFGTGPGDLAPAKPVHDEDLAVLLYTSGTTGRPKGVMLSHGNIWWNHVNVDSVVPTKRDDVTYAAAPLFHIGGLNALVIRALIRGGTVVVRRVFTPDAAIDDFVTHRVTTLFGVPAMFAAIARDPRFSTTDLTLNAAIVAGAPVPPQLIRQYAERDIMLQQAWGLTETAPFATYLPQDQTRVRMGSAGVPMPFTEVKVVDPFDGSSPTEAGTRGEVCVRGPNVTRGYWRNPEATRQAFDEQGWFHSGDIGYLDDEGYLYIVDRLKDLIISGGENIYPAEVENAIIGMPGVLEVAVVGQPDEKWGETVIAVLTCEDGHRPDVEQVREYASRSLARYKLPTRVVHVGELPRKGSGKLDKVAIRDVVRRQPD